MTEQQYQNRKSEKKSAVRKPGTIVFVAAFAAFLATFNETFLNVSFALIMEELGISVATVQWLATAYMLGAAVMVPVSAFLYRNVPTKNLFLISVGLLITGSIVGALSETFPVLLAGRIIQALGTGMLIPIGMNITLEVAPKRKLGTYMGIMGAMTTLGPSSSVIIAGALLSFFNWHMLLWVFAGLSLLCFICGALFLHNIAHLTHPKLDIPSTILIGIALIGILYGVSTVFSGNPALAVIAAALGGIFLISFILRQKKLSQPLIDLRPLGVKPFAIGVIINMITLIVIFAMNIIMPLFIQNILGGSALSASLTLFPAILLSCIISPVAGRIFDKNGAKVLLPLGFILICLFTLALAFAKDSGSLVLLGILYVPVICGSALIIGPVQSLALSHLAPELKAHGVTVMSTGFQIAGCIGSSLFAGVYSLSALGNSGFTAASLLASAFAILGIALALGLGRLARTSKTAAAAAGSFEALGIASVMKKEAYTVSIHATVLDALKCMSENKVSGLPIIDDFSHVSGFIADGDIIRFMLGNDCENASFASMYPLWHDSAALDDRLSQLSKINVMELATDKIVAVELEGDIESLFRALSNVRVKKVPILKDGKLIGTASRSDLLRKLLTHSSFIEKNAV